jgi:cyclophilin family peptidyl-prolyl cis-trans isomerase
LPSREIFTILVLLLGIGWQTRALADDPFRAIELQELHRSADASLIAQLDNSDARIAARAALALGRTKAGGQFALAALERVLGASSNPAVRAMCAYAIGLSNDGSRDVALRIISATHDSNSAVRYAAVDALGRIERDHPLSDVTLATSLAGVLEDVAAHDDDSAVRGHAAIQLDVYASLPSAAAIAKSLERIEATDPDPGVRWHAAFTLYRTYARFADASFLARALHDSNELVRVETLRAYGRRADPATRALIEASLGDPSWRVQFEAREALRALVKLGRSEHLRRVPPGTHLPAIRSPRIAFQLGPDGLGVAPFESPHAPDPATLPLVPVQLPITAAAMNGPAPGPHPRVLVRTTRGDVVVRLYPEWAPSTVANFLQLAQSGFYDGNPWFRIVPDFVAQTGDPTGNADAEAGYTIPAEENPVEQRSGIIAMGLDYADNKPLRDSAGTQFYFTLSPQPYLGRDFTVFGEISSGFDVVANLVESDRMTLVRRIQDG